MTDHPRGSCVPSVAVGRQRLQLVSARPTAEDEASSRISFWWSLTASALALARHLDAGGSLEGRRVIELGCGLGLAGATAALLGAEVVFTDANANALVSARELCRINGVGERVRFQALDWERPPGDLGEFDLVLGSEILYDYYSHSDLLALLQRLIGPSGAARLADRKRLVVSRFLGRLIDAGFACQEEQVPVSQASLPETQSQLVSVFVLRRTVPGA